MNNNKQIANQTKKLKKKYKDLLTKMVQLGDFFEKEKFVEVIQLKDQLESMLGDKFPKYKDRLLKSIGFDKKLDKKIAEFSNEKEDITTSYYHITFQRFTDDPSKIIHSEVVVKGEDYAHAYEKIINTYISETIHITNVFELTKKEFEKLYVLISSD